MYNNKLVAGFEQQTTQISCITVRRFKPLDYRDIQKKCNNYVYILQKYHFKINVFYPKSKEDICC